MNVPRSPTLSLYGPRSIPVSSSNSRMAAFFLTSLRALSYPSSGRSFISESSTVPQGNSIVFASAPQRVCSTKTQTGFSLELASAAINIHQSLQFKPTGLKFGTSSNSFSTTVKTGVFSFVFSLVFLSIFCILQNLT